jgi:hypothetical protein
MKYAKVTLCDSGYVNWEPDRFWKWRTYRCNKCNVIVLPYNIRYIDPTYLKYIPGGIKHSIENWRWGR